MSAGKKQLQIVAPVGDVPRADDDLRKRVEKLPKDANLSQVFEEVSQWEKVSIKKFREQEQTKKSGKLTVRC